MLQCDYDAWIREELKDNFDGHVHCLAIYVNDVGFHEGDRLVRFTINRHSLFLTVDNPGNIELSSLFEVRIKFLNR